MGNEASAAQDEPLSHLAGQKPTSPEAQKQTKRRDSVQAYPPKAAPATGTTTTSAVGESSTGSRGSERARATTIAAPQNIPKTAAMGNTGSSGDERAAATSTESKSSPSKPIPVPQRQGSQRVPDSPSYLPARTAAYMSQQHRHGSIGYADPPRLPLPIQEDDVDPGSPILLQEDMIGEHTSDLELDETNYLGRKYSMSTANEDDEDDIFRPPKPNIAVELVPTLIEWREPGATTVFVSGTFADFWQKKYKLSKNGPSTIPGAHSAIINLEDHAVHHVTFLVDGRMRVAEHLPTTVDFTETIVNYIDLLPKKKSMPSESRRVSATKDRYTEEELATLRKSDKKEPSPPPSVAAEEAEEAEEREEESDQAQKKPVTDVYHQYIPQYLMDSERREGDPLYERSQDMLSTVSNPPTLPSWLTKNILNSATPRKDDASVLLNPSHTVINHLSTSSIKGGVIATSMTTRYKSKFLTTIYYKPTSDED